MSHSLAQVWTHIIFSTKDRMPLLADKSLQEKTHRYLRGVAQNLGCRVCAIGGIEDHVHLLVSLPKTLSLATLVEKLKTSSSKWIKSQHDGNSALSQFHWQGGYGGFSVSQSMLQTVVRYIDKQEEHHKGLAYLDELSRLLNEYQLLFDPNHL
jgi:REP element-mobilizing transposase RayT